MCLRECVSRRVPEKEREVSRNVRLFIGSIARERILTLQHFSTRLAKPLTNELHHYSLTLILAKVR